LSALLRRRDRRRRGRPRRHPGPPRPSCLARRGRPVAVADLPLSHEGLRLRRRGLLRRRSALRDTRRLRPVPGRGARARHARSPRLGPEPHLRPASVVPRVARLAREPRARLVRLARPGARRGPAEQLARRLPPRHAGVDVRRRDGAVLSPSLPSRAARPGLVDAYAGDRVLVGEVWLLLAQTHARYYGRGDELHLLFELPAAVLTPWDADAWRARIADVAARLDPIDAWPTWVLSNHDVPRHR